MQTSEPSSPHQLVERPITLVERPVRPEPPTTLEPRGRLTRKQRLFTEYYLRGHSAQKAALLAGYSPFTACDASTLILRNPQVQTELRRRRDEYFRDEKIDTDWVIQEAAFVAKANMLDYIDVDKDRGTFEVNLKNVTRDMGSAIQELSYDPLGRPKIRLADKKAALELLAKLKKMFDDPSKGPTGGAFTIQTLDRIIQNVTVNQQFNVVGPNSSQEPLTLEP